MPTITRPRLRANKQSHQMPNQSLEPTAGRCIAVRPNDWKHASGKCWQRGDAVWRTRRVLASYLDPTCSFVVQPMASRRSPSRFALAVIRRLTILLSAGCQKKTAATNPNSQSKTELPENTKPLQAADLVGYDGTKLRKSVDHIREANDKHNQEIKKTVETGPDQ